MLISRDFAHSLEHCFYQSHLKYNQFFKQETHYGEMILLSSGGAFYCGKDSVFSQAIAWGFDVGFDFESEITQIEFFFQQQGMNQCAIELSPLCQTAVIELLYRRNYRLGEVTTILVMDLSTYKPVKPKHRCELNDREQLNPWVNMMAQGFSVGIREKKQFTYFAQTPSIYPFSAFIDGNIVAGGVVGLHGDYCDLSMTCTLEPYRGQGLQKDLLNKRLVFARRQGAKIAVIAAEPGSISESNCQAMGFYPAYTRLKMIKVFE